MSLYQYSVNFPADKISRSQAYDQNASYKDLTQVCKAVRDRSYTEAVRVLEDAVALRKPIRYYSHGKRLGHRPQLGGKKGRFPRKECRLVLELLRNAFANAQFRGLKEDALVVLHAQAYKQNVFPRYRRFFVGGNSIGYGKYAVFSNYSTARVEIILGEKNLKPVGRKTKAQSAAEKKALAKKEKATASEAVLAEKENEAQKTTAAEAELAKKEKATASEAVKEAGGKQ